MKRLKIAQQMIIVLVLAVLIPSIIIGFIITNVSQQSVRRELNYSALSLAEFIGQNIEFYLENSEQKLIQTADALAFIKTDVQKRQYFKRVGSISGFKSFKIIDSDKVLGTSVFDVNSSTLNIYAPIDDKKSLSAQISVDVMKDALRERFKDEKRQIFVLDIDNTLIVSNTQDTSGLENIIKKLPSKKEVAMADLFGDIKNQPMAYYKIENPGWCVVVNTTEKITKNTINVARFRIITAISLAGLFIIFLISLYTYYLYINIRQLFKGIIAISKGSYERKIHLIKNIFTPHEIVFLAKEFNFMAKKVAQSHKELYEKNLQLQRLDGFRANLVSATSHEFRTPLTNIVGYSSRLLRQDIEIDEETRIKSLKIIKQQAQRLSRMVEDLLVIPEIESFHLQLNLQEENLAKLIEESVFYVNSSDEQFEVSINEDLKPVFVDKDRMIQILVNLCDNAIKYNTENKPIKVVAFNNDNKNIVSISNYSEEIGKENLPKLFDKFVRLDSDLTRTTRGTGLGLYIVKGLATAMNIDVSLDYDHGNFIVNLAFNEKIEPEIQDEDE